VLGATQSDSDEEIKKKYKRAVMEYHPDRVVHLGQELRDLAARKSRSINEAYAIIRQLRGV
jgi:DnaJ like chaperone protein